MSGVGDVAGSLEDGGVGASFFAGASLGTNGAGASFLATPVTMLEALPLLTGGAGAVPVGGGERAPSLGTGAAAGVGAVVSSFRGDT